jgi:hypothetical protein
MAVVPYLLFCFVVDHSQATCAKIFNVIFPRLLFCREYTVAYIVAPVRSRSHWHCGTKSALKVHGLDAISFLETVTHPVVRTSVILLIRTYAFFNRNPLLLAILIAAMAGVVAYQLYVATSQMQCSYFLFELFSFGKIC